MSYLIETMNAPILNCSRAARMGRRLVALGLGMKALNGVVAVVLMMALGVVSASAQTPSGSFFNGNSGPARQQFAIRHVLSGGGNDHCGDHLRRRRNHHVRSARVALDMEIHYRSRMFRLRRNMRGDLCLQPGRYRPAGQSVLISVFPATSRLRIFVYSFRGLRNASTSYQTKHLSAGSALWRCRQ